MKHNNLFSLKAIIISILVIQFAFSSAILAQEIKDFKGYGSATCSGFTDNNFIKNWLILGPIGISNAQQEKIDEAALKKAFDEDFLTSVTVDKSKGIEPLSLAGELYSWKSYSSKSDIIQLDKFLGDTNNILCYALTEIVTAEPKKVLIGLGSDDGVKVWVNGREVHNNNIGRAVTIDDDLFEIALIKGSNQVLIKIENQSYGYGFSFRPLGKDFISDLVITNSGSGDFDNVKMLMKYSPDLKKTNTGGLTAWQLATVKGRSEIAQFLEKNGADKSVGFPSLDKYIDNTLSPYTGKDTVPGVALLIAKEGTIIYKKGFGNANLEENLSAGTDVKFRIGSITKQFTASAILRLQEQGKINVTDKLSMYFPDFPRGNEVTIHHLLTHTSGLHNFTDRRDFMDIAIKPITEEDLYDIIKSDTFDFNPGDRFSYCNSGYVLLGFLVSKISGKPYSQYLSDEFFGPLGMKNSGVYDNSKRPANEAIGYTFQNGKMVKSADTEMSWAAGAGAIYSTVEDLFVWNEAVFNGRVLNEKSMKMAFTPGVLNNKEQTPDLPYGYGWMLSDFRGMKFIAHGGGVEGFVSSLSRQPDEKLTVAVLMNSTPAFMEYYPAMLSNDVAEYMLWQKMASQATYSADTSLSADQLKVFTGSYDYGHGMILKVTLEGEHLMAQMTGQPAFEIYYMGNNEFYWKVVEARIKFITNEQGKVTGATHFQGGQQLQVSRMPGD